MAALGQQTGARRDRMSSAGTNRAAGRLGFGPAEQDRERLMFIAQGDPNGLGHGYCCRPTGNPVVLQRQALRQILPARLGGTDRDRLAPLISRSRSRKI
jgi:hypothetical protein